MAGFHLDDTIAAVSTAMAPAGIGIVRISGNDAFEVADRVFRAKKEGKKLSAVKSHTIHYGWIITAFSMNANTVIFKINVINI